ncbi:hypothetical protein GX51_03153 [Blastomyces parvus]|uniref:Uncharacterized protein n=1 Tax=Blastomyces parvus TaxID=2060905 RepID=A0A2B7X7W2_9EURO|nr:hypothetical protein GX51_03153 [Blastomyces parvus]
MRITTSMDYYIYTAASFNNNDEQRRSTATLLVDDIEREQLSQVISGNVGGYRYLTHTGGAGAGEVPGTRPSPPPPRGKTRPDQGGLGAPEPNQLLFLAQTNDILDLNREQAHAVSLPSSSSLTRTALDSPRASDTHREPFSQASSHGCVTRAPFYVLLGSVLAALPLLDAPIAHQTNLPAPRRSAIISLRTLFALRRPLLLST